MIEAVSIPASSASSLRSEEFYEVFIKNRGNIKEVEKELGISIRQFEIGLILDMRLMILRMMLRGCGQAQGDH